MISILGRDDMEKSKLKSFFKRLATAIVLVPVAVGCVLKGYPWIYILALLGAALLSWEWSDMVKNKKPSVYACAYLFVASIALLLASFWAGVIVLVLATVTVFLKAKEEDHRWLLTLGVPYIAIGLGSVLAIYSTYGSQIVLWYLCVIWGVDIGGYMFGCTIKGPKLAPKISPNKTWAGLIGGMVLSVLISWAVCWYYEAGIYTHIYSVLAAVLAVVAQIGDLIESSIKRYLGVKDSSNLIPGHGGIFDRIDGLIFAAPIAYILLTNLRLFVD